MRGSRFFASIFLILSFTYATFIIAGDTQLGSDTIQGKEPLSGSSAQNTPLALFAVQPEDTKCVDDCFRRNQMGSVGFEIIQDQCERECNLEEVLTLLESSLKETYTKGVKALCEVNDPRAVQPLIGALKRDLKERSGLWAWIIPALGALGDPAAVQALTYTLTLADDDWLGREMSARSLGSIGAPSAVPHLLAAAWRADTRDAAIEALVNFRDKRSIPVFLSALDPEEDKQTREAAINGLHFLGSVAVPELIEAFSNFSSEHPDTEKRLWLCQLLGTSGDDRAIKILHKSMTDPDKIIGQCAEGFSQSQK